MSVPQSPSNMTPSSQGRVIAPLPLRSRRNRNAESSQKLSQTRAPASPRIVSATEQYFSAALGIPHNGIQKLDASEDAHSFQAPLDVTKMSFQFNESEPPESIPQYRWNFSSLPNSSRTNHELQRPLSSARQEGILNNSNVTDREIRIVVEENTDSITESPRFSSSRSSALTMISQESNLNPPPGGFRERSLSDASAASDQDEATVPYDVTEEEAPPEPFFTPPFQNALQNGLHVAKSLVSAIQGVIGSSEPSGDLERFLNDATGLSNFHNSGTRTIAVLGDSGEGKSSLINALLHFPEIAKTGDIGAACTSVVTEYRQRTLNHTAPITIEVEYLSISEIEDLIKELLWNYRKLFLPGMEDDEVDAREYARCQRESEQAWSALEAGFKHKREFNERLLRDMSEGGIESATDKLIRWAGELDWPDDDNSGIWKSTAETADECCEKTSVFMQDRFWPFTKIIRVYLNSHVLKTGIVLADLPGLQDTNLARVRATQTYLMRCDNVFIVAKISRAITDQSLKSSLYNILARHAPVEWEESGGKSFNLAVICTKSEDINQKTAIREFCGPNKRLSLQEMEQLDRDIENAKKNRDKALKKQLKRKKDLVLINARSKHVKEGLQNAYASKVPGGKLDVFCVSNTTYEKYSRKGNAEMVHASGIPDLRRFCHTITAEAQLLEAKHFLQSTLSSLIQSVEIWASSSIVPQEVEGDGPHTSILDFMHSVERETCQSIKDSRTNFKATLKEALSEYLEKRNEHWENAAAAKGLEWHSWHWSQFDAWCRNRGEHSTAKRGHLNWNAEIIWKMRMELAYQWNLLEEEIPTVFGELLFSTRLSFQSLKLELEDEGFPPALVGGIDFRIQDIEYRFSLLQQQFAREFKMIHRHASEPNDSSYVVHDLISTYRAAAAQSGGDKAARQRNIVQGRITSGTLFPHISVTIQKNLEELIMKTFRDLRKIAESVFASIARDVEIVVASAPARAIMDVDNVEDQRRKTVMMGELEELKGKHDDLILAIAEF